MKWARFSRVLYRVISIVVFLSMLLSNLGMGTVGAAYAGKESAPISGDTETITSTVTPTVEVEGTGPPTTAPINDEKATETPLPIVGGPDTSEPNRYQGADRY